MDVRNLDYPDNHFDLAVDKSTIDALLCGVSSFVSVARMIKEIQRVLKVGGVYMAVSYGPPESRVFHFERDHLSFDINIYTIKKDYTIDEAGLQKFEKLHYVYICKKRPEADEMMKSHYLDVIAQLEIEEKMEEEICASPSNSNKLGEESEGLEDFDHNDDEGYFDDRIDSEDKEEFLTDHITDHNS